MISVWLLRAKRSSQLIIESWPLNLTRIPKCSITLHDVRQFKKSVKNESSLKEYTLLFRAVSCSSVEIILAFPPEAHAKLSEVISADQLRREHKVHPGACDHVPLRC